jgi:site-specific recombinase XerD
MAAPPAFTPLTVSEVITAFTADMERKLSAGTMSPTTADTYARDLVDFARLAGPDVALDSLSAEDVDDIVLTFRSEPDRRRKVATDAVKSLGTTARFRQSLSSLFSFAEKRAFVRKNPMPETVTGRRGRVKATGARAALPLDAARALVTVPTTKEPTRRPRKDQDVSRRDEIILRILLETGLRVSELCALDRTDVRPQDGATWLFVRHGKGGKPREVPITPSTATMLDEYVNSSRPVPEVGAEDAQRALFVTYRGRRITPRDVQNLVNRAAQGLPPSLRRRVTPHAARHSAATLLLSSGAADVSVVQKLLGHASLATTGLYLDEIRDELVQAVHTNPITESR